MRAPLVRTRYNAIGRQRQVHGRPSCVSAIPNLTDLRPAPADILGDVLAGLAQRPRRLPSKYFYDHRGSVLFELITRQPERSEERRVGKELVRQCRFWWSAYHLKKKANFVHSTIFVNTREQIIFP